MRTSLQAYTGAILYLGTGILLVGRPRSLQAWGIRMALQYPHLYSSAAFRNWLHSPWYVPRIRTLGVIALGFSAVLFHAAHASAKR